MGHPDPATEARGHTSKIAALCVASMITLIACGSDDAGDTTTSSTEPTSTTSTTTTLATTTTSAPTTTAEATTTTTDPSAGDTIEISSEGDFGTHLVDGSGRSLYLFLTDAQSASTCVGGCAATWPPFTISATAGSGVNPDLLGTVAREDGAEQVTYNGWPLYHYGADLEPGDVLGQGLGSVWFLVDAEGNPVGQAS
jgi:predicted lipoprotein with Yx(FWY)xxD motif